MEISNSFKMSPLHKTNGLPLQQTLALIKVIKMDPYNEETKNNISNALQMGSTSHLQYLKETPKDYHFWYVCSDGLSTLKQRKITILASIVIIV